MKLKIIKEPLFISKFFDKKGKAVLTSRLWIPYSYLKKHNLIKYIKKTFIRNIFDYGCNEQCERFIGRNYEECKNCQNFLMRVVLAKSKVVKGVKYIGIPYGSSKIRIFADLLNEIKIQDRRVAPKMSYQIEFTGKLLEKYYQPQITKVMIETGYGQLSSPTRSGKTIQSIYIITKLGLKTLILAHQDDLLEQFYDKMTKVTNFRDIEMFEGKKIVGFYGDKNWENYDVVLSTYQKFITEKGRKRLKEIKNKFGIILVDECHKASTKCFSQVIIDINAKHKFGVSATTERRDNLHFIAQHILGIVQVYAEDKGLKCALTVHKTGVKLSAKSKRLPIYMIPMYLANIDKRNKMIVDMIVTDARDRGRFVLVPVIHKKHLFKLREELEKKGLSVEVFHRGCNKKKILEKADKGKVQVVIGIRKMLSHGLDVQMWDVIYEIFPLANPYTYYQEISRIRTPYNEVTIKRLGRDKPKPIIRYFLDDMPQSYNAFLKTLSVHKKYCDTFPDNLDDIIRQVKDVQNARANKEPIPLRIKRF